MEINIKDLSVTYKQGKTQKQALKNINLELKSPNFIGLLGPNGAGKSTFMKILVSKILPTSGSITVNGVDLRKCENDIRKHLGYLPQSFGLHDELTVYQFLDYMAALKNISGNVNKEINDVIEQTNLQDKSHCKIKTLSGGQKQRVGIAQVLLGNPELIILDESTVGLDPEERIKFRNIFSKYANDKIVLLSTHIIDDIQAVCNRVVIINNGKILFNDVSQKLIRLTQGHVGLINAKDDSSLKSAMKEGYKITSKLFTSEGISCRVIAKKFDSSISIVEPSLEDAYEFIINYGGDENVEKYIFRETKCTLFSKVTLFTILSVILFALLSIYISNSNFDGMILSIRSKTLLTQAILFPAKLITVFGSAVFAVLTILELNKIKKYDIGMVMQPYISDTSFFIYKIISQIIIAFVTVSILIFVIFPYYFYTMGNLSTLHLYILSYYGITFISIVCSILISSGIYLITQNPNLTYIIVFFAFVFSFSAGMGLSYLFNWVQSPVSGYSEYFGNSRVIQALSWNRAFCLLVSACIFLLGLLCTRCYEKGVFRSIFINYKKHLLVFISFIVSMILAVGLYKFDPIFKNVNPLDMMILILKHQRYSMYENNQIKTISGANVDLNIKNETGYVSGIFKQTLSNTTSQNQKLFLVISPGSKIDYVRVNGKKASFNPLEGTSATTRIYNIVELESFIPGISELEISYSGFPKVISTANNFSICITKDYVDYGQALIPQLLIESSTSEVKGTLNINSDLEVVTTGSSNEKISDNGDGTTTWSFSCKQSDRMYLYVAKYESIKTNVDGAAIEFFYPKDGSELFVDRRSDLIKVFRHFSNVVGPLELNNLPWKIITTSGISGGGGAASGNIINVSEDCLSRDKRKMGSGSQITRSDSISLLTHEIAHLWWGIGINVSDKSRAEWSSEGFAEFSTYIFLKSRYGQSYADELLLNKWSDMINNLNRDFYVKHPEYLDKLPGPQRWLVSMGTMNSLLYAKCPFEIYKVYNLVGEERFISGLRNIYSKYYQKPDKTLTFSAFLDEMGVSNEEFDSLF